MSESEEVTARQELEELAEVLKDAIESEKQWKKLKEEVRGPFFELISEIVRDEIPLATQVETLPNDGADLEAWRQQNWPEYRIISIDPDGDEIKVTLQENERLKKFEFIHNGFKFGRTIRMKDAHFDAEGFIEKLKEPGQFSKRVWKELVGCIEQEVVTTYTLDEAKALEVMADYPETVTLFQQFQHPGTPEVALLPIRAAKEEDDE